MDLVSQAQASQKGLEDALSSAFLFLVNDYNYKEEPVTYGPSHFQAFTKIFSLGTRSIEFSGNYDRKLFYDLVFHPINLQARGELHPSIIYRPHWYFSIYQALNYLDAEVSLPQTGTIEDVASAFSEVLRSYTIELVEGDFSIFPSIEFVVSQVLMPDEFRETLGRFSTIEEAEKCALSKAAALHATSKKRIEIIGQESDARGNE